MLPSPATIEEVEIPAREVVLGLVGLYNRAYWPAAAFGAVAAFAALALVLIRPGTFSDMVAKVLLDLLWLWTGIIFFLGRLAPEFHVAYLFAAAFALQGTYFFVDVFFGNLEFRPYKNGSTLVAALILLFAAAVVHPILASALGRGWPKLTLVGTGPGPTAAATLALLMFTLHKPKPSFFLIPAAWALGAGIGVAQGWHFYEELVPAGVALAVLLWLAAAARRPKGPPKVKPAEGAPL
jgi:hypothetical protein